ncbi:magnesium transporter [Enterococcus timonensis]|uniref:magnesium transporter n=1 Tax=Enterococcus timonensis TaxID=1852364 RepID=UPI0008D9FCE2|nr:magnesium transporter [Enterococcus timonensis]
MSEENNLQEKFQELKKLLINADMTQFRAEFLDLHLYDQAQFYQQIDSELRVEFYNFLSPQEVADLFDLIEEDDRQIPIYLKEMRPAYVAEMLSGMYIDNAVDLLDQLEPDQMAKYLSLMSRQDAGEMKELLHYEDQTAGAIMTTEFVSIVGNQTVSSALLALKVAAKEAETIYYIYVLDEENHLAGVISLRDLIVNDDDVFVYDVMSTRVITVEVGDEQTQAAQTIRDYDFLALPVTDYENHLLGIITVDDVLDVMDEEATSDYSGLAGVDVDIVSENPLRASLKRLPWLVTLLFLGMSTASLISHYEELVSEASILAVFISLITGTAGNAGTQSLAVAVRRLAIGDDEGKTFFGLILKEILTGLITGVVTGVTVFLMVGIWKQNFALGLVVGMAMLFAIVVANLAGSLIPMLMERLGFDPAVASGPFITTLSDLTSVLIYFNIAALFMNQFI